jgi:uncharacterized protein (DUF362 family)
MKRRDFLKATLITASTLSACAKSERAIPEVTEAQRALKSATGRSRVALIPCKSYEEDIFALLKDFAARLPLPPLKDKNVVLKPNMVEYRTDKDPITTNCAVIAAAIKLVRHLGAKDVVVAEGPGHMRDTEYLLDVSGIGRTLKELEVRFVDLNLDDIVKVENVSGFTSLKEFYLPKTIVEADTVVSLPKFKTHHWVGVTCSMKNFFGAVPGRKYGWPKNLLHRVGIERSIVDLMHMIKPTFAIADGIIAMEGDGPINGRAIATNFIGMSTDLAALDATVTRIASIDPMQLPYLVLAGLCVGNVDADQIETIGATIDKLKKPFDQPITLKDRALLDGAGNAGS